MGWIAVCSPLLSVAQDDGASDTTGTGGGVDLDDPENYDTDIRYDHERGEYVFYNTVGDSIQREVPRRMSMDEYFDQEMARDIEEYWEEKKQAERVTSSEGVKPELDVGGDVVQDIFGDSTIQIRPQGSAALTFGVNSSRTENPQIPEKQRRITTFDFDQQIQLNVVGKIGDKMKLEVSYDTEAQFNFENEMNLNYTGEEDDIIKKIEAGNVSMPLKSSLIRGSQSLFGVKTKLHFGRLKVTSVFSQQKGEKKEIEVSGGAQSKRFDIKADEYEANKHYFLSHYFRDNYNDALSSLPVVGSNIDISKIEVWITNKTNTTENTRNIVAMSDLGEATGYSEGIGIQPGSNTNRPDNDHNDVYSQVSSNSAVRGFFNANSALRNMQNPGPYEAGTHFEKVENARKLSKNEYTFNRRLGFISLNRSLDQDEVLAVAYEYTFQGETFQVGEFSTDGVDGKDALVLKLLKPTNNNPNSTLWDLMMKNVYSLSAYQLSSENFQLRVWYNDPSQGVDLNYIPQPPIDNTSLIQVLNADRLNKNGDTIPDGTFDFIDNAATQGGTVESNNGRIFFPVVEPFGDHLREIFENAGVDSNIVNNIVYDPLYDSTKTAARQIPQLNRFRMKGSYESQSGSQINLNALNIPEGSVTVTAGGVKLEEGVDYTVDYNLGRVKIINQGLLESQTPINVSLESNSAFSVQSKRLMGSRFDYRVAENFNVGATVMNLTERPLTQKVNIGDAPINNTIWGVDANYQTESTYLTKMVDNLPLIDTKEKSTIDLAGEFAHLIPGQSKAIGDQGTSYIDDFEGSQSGIDIRTPNNWTLASTPQGQPDMFPEGQLSNDRAYGYNRANLSWYTIDPLFFRNNNLTPEHIANDPDMQSDHRMREVLEQEVFPNRELPAGTPTNIAMFDLAYYPSERGPYNYDTDGEQGISQGVKSNGELQKPSSRWGGIMRDLRTTDFEQANVMFIEFWLMDPFNKDSRNQKGGDLYFNLGNISEDILRDSRKNFENGLPTGTDPDPSDVDTTTWGQVPTTQSIVNAFDNDPDSRKFQDVGLDGMRDQGERQYFNDYLNKMQNIVSQGVYDKLQSDPSGDGYNYYRDDDYDDRELNILERYKEFRGLDGNSPTTEQSEQQNDAGYPTSATTRPDVEDINQDNNLSENESYYQYHVSLRESDLKVGKNYVADKRVATPNTQNGETRPVTWYQFRIPVRAPDKVVNNIQDFRSIRFMRMFLRNFEEPAVLRFARLELVRGEWRIFRRSLKDDGENQQDDPPETSFNISAVNIEENGNRTPINYVVPPGIDREVNQQTTNLSQMNEQSLQLDACNLQDGDARAAYKNVEFDLRRYKKLKMFSHLEASRQGTELEKGDVTLFIRLGSDFNENYYEYEMPLKASEWGENQPREVWPKENEMEIALKELINAKQKRNQQDHSLLKKFECKDCAEGDRIVRVKGTPNLADARTIMIGVRNPDQQGDNPYKPDDGMPKCFKVWVNELRVSEFDNKGGWAATSSMNAQLADLGDLSLSGKISKPGFGSLGDKLNERQRKEVKQVDASSNLKLGKFFPDNSGIKVPTFLSYSERVETPEFDPLAPDIEFDESISEKKGETREKHKERSRSYTKRRSINFTNVRKQRGKNAGDPKIWDIENFSLSYSYNERFERNIDVKHSRTREYQGSINYGFSPQPKKVEPFGDIGFLGKSNWLDPIEQFNFYPVPNQLNVSTTINRRYNDHQIRSNIPTTDITFDPTFTKTFRWNRQYGFSWGLTQSLELQFNANSDAIVGEPPGRVDRELDPEGYEVFRDSVMRSIQNFGETTDYNHQLDLNYQLPLDKLPATDWINSNLRYSATYNWQRAPLAQDSLGHTIQNSRNVSINGKLDFNKLYNKVGFLQEINQNGGGSGRGRGRRGRRGGGRGGGDGEEESDTTEAEEGMNETVKSVLEGAARVLMGLKDISISYSRNQGTLLPGYDRRTNVIGMSRGFGGPGAGFVLGKQERDIFGRDNRFGERDSFPDHAADQGWLVESPYLNRSHTITNSENINIQASVRPVQQLRIDINANRQRSREFSEFFRYNDSLQRHQHQSPRTSGSISMTVNTLQTAFDPNDDKDRSEVFQKFRENRTAISKRLGQAHPGSSPVDTSAFYGGYGGTQQNVLVPAFIAAYTGQDPDKVKTDPTKMVPKPNWRVNYDGLSRVGFFKEHFRSIRLSHGYQSTMSTSYQTNLNYEGSNGDPAALDQQRNYIPRREIASLSISEQFSPLFKIDMTWNNSLKTKVEMKKSRNLSYSLTNNQLTEVKSREIVVGTGYTIKELELPFMLMGNQLKSDLDARADFSVRNNKTVTRKLVEQQNEVTSGQRVMSIKVSGDYKISDNLNVRLFYDKVVNEPFISTTFPTSNTNAGLELRFTLAP